MEHTVFVGIHPAYFDEVDEVDWYASQRKYKGRRDDLLQDTSLDHVLLLAHSQIEITKNMFNLKTPYWDNRIFPTAETSPKLLNYSFKQFSLFLENHFPATSYILWGAELHIDKHGDIDGGCVKQVYDELSLPHIQIEEDACFVYGELDKNLFSLR